jgi:hypothetical protein
MAQFKPHPGKIKISPIPRHKLFYHPAHPSI